MRTRLLVGALIALPVLAAAGFAAASNERSEAAVASVATARFHDLEAAQASGYTAIVTDLSGATCIAEPGEGAMGVHYLNPRLVDGTIEAAAPEALVYEARNNGTLKLVALEYIVFKDVWEAAGNSAPPSLFGQTFDLVASPNRYGAPSFYALHAWIWKPNPSGLIYAWNPRVDCAE